MSQLNFTSAAEREAHLAVVATLKDAFTTAQLNRESYSLRRFARRIGVPAPVISQVLNGRRKVTQKLAQKLLELLPVENDRRQQILKGLPSKRTRNVAPKADYEMLALDSFELISDWWHFAILSLGELEAIPYDDLHISRRLGIPRRNARSSLETLSRLGMIENREGFLAATGKKFSTVQDIPSVAIKKNHLQGLELAREALMTLPVELREFGASVMCADPEKMPEYKALLRKFRRALARLAAAHPKREVYRIQVQFFPVTKEMERSE